MIRLLLAAASLAQGPAPFDANQYPLDTFAAVAARGLCRPAKDGYEVKDVLFSAEAVFDAAYRPTSARRMELVRRWLKPLGTLDRAPTFETEIRVVEGKASLWLPTPEAMLKDIKTGVKKGDRFLIYLSLIGCVDRSPVFAVEEFNAPTYEDLEEDSSSYIT